LRLLLGVPLDQELELAGVLTSEEKALPPGPELVERALHQRSDLVAVQRAVQRAALQIGLTKREAIPNITLSGSLSRFEGDTLLGGDIAFPIPIFRRRTSDIDEALAERERATLLLQNLERDVAKQVQEARRACGVAAGNLEAQRRDIVPKSEENLDLERRLYERGEASLLEVIGAQIDLFSARRDYLDALEAYNISLIELERAIGGNLDGR
jgi:outer membrane protein TolC